MEVCVSGEGLSPEQRQEFWRLAMSETFVPLEVEDLDAERFTGSIQTRDVGELMIADVRSSPQEIRRTGRLIAGSDRDLFQIAVARCGRAHLEQDGREVTLTPGDFTIYETDRPFRWGFDQDWAATVFTLPRDRLALSRTESRLLTARCLSGRAGTSAVVSRFMCDLAAHVGHEPWRQSRRVTSDLVDLVVALLVDDLDRGAAGRNGRQRALVLQVKEFIADHLTDPGLSPATIAAAHHVSIRYLHKLFETEPVPVAALIREQRLGRCARNLLDPRYAHLSVAAIAAEAGFGDLSGFGRAFKAAYGLTPREYRAIPAAGPPPLPHRA